MGFKPLCGGGLKQGGDNLGRVQPQCRGDMSPGCAWECQRLQKQANRSNNMFCAGQMTVAPNPATAGNSRHGPGYNSVCYPQCEPSYSGICGSLICSCDISSLPDAWWSLKTQVSGLLGQAFSLCYTESVMRQQSKNKSAFVLDKRGICPAIHALHFDSPARFKHAKAHKLP
jgi:hypothetical protein